MRDEPNRTFLAQAERLCREQGATLLYLTLFGSTLYGTETPGASDVDVRGIFLPSQQSLALQSAPRSLRRSTADGARRNNTNDVDIDLWSVQRWLLQLLPEGDTGALDLLFSPSHAACTLFRDPRLDPVFASPLRLLDTRNNMAYAEYSLGQAKKYGIRGSRVGALKTVRQWLRQHCPAPESGARLRDVLANLAADCADGRFCVPQNIQGEPALRLCGKMHMGGIRLIEFISRVEEDMRRHGGRAEAAQRGQGLDYKALSHALRALDQMEELLTTGGIEFPLKTRTELIKVKQGAYAWAELEPRILARLRDIDVLRRNAPCTGEYDRGFAESRVLACYGL